MAASRRRDQTSAPGRAVSVAYEDLARLKPWPRNPKDHDVQAIAASIQEFGFRDPVAANRRSGEVEEGHGRLEALAWLKRHGRKAPGGIRARNGSWFVPVIWFDDPQEIQERYALAHNRTQELGGFDDAKLAAVLAELSRAGEDALLATGYDGDDVDAFLARLRAPANHEEDGPPDLDRAEIIQERWQVRRGQLWAIHGEAGEHRLLCSDWRCSGALDRITEGARIRALVTDPPYGISIVKLRGRTGEVGGHDAPEGGKKRGRMEKIGASNPIGGKGQVRAGRLVAAGWYTPIIGDQQSFDPRPLLGLAPVVILFGANCYADKLPPSRGWIVWDKIAGLEMTTTSFSDAELIWTNQDGPVRILRHLWHGLVRKEEHGKRTHPTQKPVAVFRWLLERFTEPGDRCLDVYAGSGPLFAAAEQSRRIAYGVEIEPKYLAVTLQRLADMGLRPELVA